MRGSRLVAVGLISACTRAADPTPDDAALRGAGDAAALPKQASAAPALPPPSCSEAESSSAGPWPRAPAPARVVAGHLEQSMADGTSPRLRFLGTHAFDLLDKLEHEARSEEDRRRIACVALEAAAATGAPVVRIWGSLKRTGDAAELDRAVRALELTLDENARRRRPLRLVIALLNHQAGYGAPRPEASLDDQEAASGWNAKTIYLEGGWRARGRGQLEERIEAIGKSAAVRTSPYVLLWELVNELDTHRAVSGGGWTGPDAGALRDRFLVPALGRLAEAVEQPIAFGELRGAASPAYSDYARALTRALSPEIRSRLVWTTHAYVPLGSDPAPHTKKLDMDLALAAELGLPFFLGELGQRAPGPARGFCKDGARHDLPSLWRSVLASAPTAPKRDGIDSVAFWGEGQCGLSVELLGGVQRVTIGAGGDTADLGPGETAARAFLKEQRASPRFSRAPGPG